MKKQVIVIHGGDTFETYEDYISSLKGFKIDLESLKSKDWKSSLEKGLGKDFEVIAPRMPNSLNAKYLEWKIWFEKLIPFFNREIILVGHSLGGIFIAKYLSENKFPKEIKATFLVAAPFDDTDSDYTLADFTLPKSLNKFEGQGGLVKLYHSKDDDVVPFADLTKYTKALPSAKALIFEDRGHFKQEKFPELVKDIKNTFK